MSCPFPPNMTIVGDLQWWQLLGTLALNKTCGDAYIRADIGGSLPPWLFTALQILVHLPVIVLRVIAWQEVQTLSIILAVFNVALISQAYAATGLTADHVLVWSPISLVIDAGAMLQLVILVRKDRPHWWKELLRSFRAVKDNVIEAGTEMQAPQGASITRPPAAHLVTGAEVASPARSASNTQPSNPYQRFNPTHSAGPTQSLDPAPLSQPTHSSTHSLASNPSQPPNPSQDSITDTSSANTSSNSNPKSKSPSKSNSSSKSKSKTNPPTQPKFVAFVIITSLLLFLAIFGLQITGVAASFHANSPSTITSSWCSPMFTVFGHSELDLNCSFRPITSDPNRGIGCISLPGERQRTWLLVTQIALIMSLGVQAVDFYALCVMPADKLWWKVNAERPLLTMVLGLGVLVLTLTVGAIDAYRLPEGITRKIWLVVDVGDPFLCTGTLNSAGLRGQFLAWLDGLLQSWGGVYFG